MAIMRKEVIRQMRAFRIFFRSIRDAFKSVVRNFSLSFASIMCTTITLILVAVAVVAAANVNNATKLIEDELTIVTYLKKDVTEEQIDNIKSEILKSIWKICSIKTAPPFITTAAYKGIPRKITAATKTCIPRER